MVVLPPSATARLIVPRRPIRDVFPIVETPEVDE